MSLKNYLILMGFSTILCWASWLIVIFYVTPDSGNLGLFLFYASLFLALAGTFSIIGFFIRYWFTSEEKLFKHIGIAFRQAILFSVLLTGCLILQSAHLLTWWNALLFILFLSILETFFLIRSEL
jgi:hypothetical protein